MPFVLTRVPLNAAERTAAPGGVPITLRPYQPVVWVRLVGWEPDPAAEGRAVAFPAVLDTGNNGTVLIAETVFRAATGTDPADSPRYHTSVVNGVPLRCYGYNLDLLSVRNGDALERVAWRLQTDRGVHVIPADLEHRFPRVPVIGVRCLTTNRLTYSLNGRRRTFSLWRPPSPPAAR
jgi:hypothetical protein